jgi:hypothetical protein
MDSQDQENSMKEQTNDVICDARTAIVAVSWLYIKMYDVFRYISSLS